MCKMIILKSYKLFVKYIVKLKENPKIYTHFLELMTLASVPEQTVLAVSYLATK